MAMARLHHDVDELTRHDDDFAHRGVPMNFCAWGSASAAARTVPSSAPTATVMWPRSLPLTCTTMVTDDVCSAAASTGIHGSSISAVRWPRAPHIACVTCGMMGESPSTAISKASCITLRSCGGALRKLRQCVQQFHCRRNRRIEGPAAPDIVGDLRQGLMRLTPHTPLRVVQRSLVERCGRALRHVIMHGLPQTLDEAIGALHPLVRPLQGLFGRRGEHGEQARGVGAEFVHQRLRIDAVVLRLRHGDDAARFDGLAVRAQHRGAALGCRIERHLDIGRIEVLHPARVRFAEKHLVQHHALSEQIRERLLERDAAQLTA